MTKVVMVVHINFQGDIPWGCHIHLVDGWLIIWMIIGGPLLMLKIGPTGFSIETSAYHIRSDEE